ncbi:MAG: rhomboid family intramembrane serine protease [Atopobiaceae bacterium]|nr:rhomboid family intramembrane serine protease [Atopobiaceae bacterium]
MYGDLPKPKSRLHVSLNAPTTLIFTALCVCATILGQVTGGAATRMFFSTYSAPLYDPFMYVRLFTHTIGHGGWDHLVSNMTYILLLGPLLEEKYGSQTLALVILLTAGITGVLNNLLFPNVVLCGASGVCFAFILLSSITSLREGEIPLTFILVAVLFLGEQVVNGIVAKDNISQFTHIIGGLVGAGLGFALGGRKVPED